VPSGAKSRALSSPSAPKPTPWVPSTTTSLFISHVTWPRGSTPFISYAAYDRMPRWSVVTPYVTPLSTNLARPSVVPPSSPPPLTQDEQQRVKRKDLATDMKGAPHHVQGHRAAKTTPAASATATATANANAIKVATVTLDTASITPSSSLEDGEETGETTVSTGTGHEDGVQSRGLVADWNAISFLAELFTPKSRLQRHEELNDGKTAEDSLASGTTEQADSLMTLFQKVPWGSAGWLGGSDAPKSRRAADPEPSSAICFTAGYLDLLSAVALGCVNKTTRRVVTSWMRGLRAAAISSDDAVLRLHTVTKVAARMPRLVDLFIGGQRLDLRWLRIAGASTNKEVLDLITAMGGGIIPPQASFALASVACSLARRSAIKRIVLRGCQIELSARKFDFKSKALDDSTVGAILGVINGARPRQLRELMLTQNRLTDASLSALARAISSGALTALKVLGLGDNRFGATGIRMIAAALTKTRLEESQSGGLAALTTLNIEGNLLGDAGVAALAGPLGCGAFPSLEILVLNRNHIRDTAPLTQAIAKGEVTQLRRLLLQKNPLSDARQRDMHETIAAAKPKPNTGPQRGSARLHDAPDSLGVNIRRLFQATHEASSQWVPAVRRGFPLRRDMASQTVERGEDWTTSTPPDVSSVRAKTGDGNMLGTDQGQAMRPDGMPPSGSTLN
jgi:hypothetical protein